MSNHNSPGNDSPGNDSPSYDSPSYDRIVIGASAGGVETVAQLIKRLPSDFPAALFVVLHFPSHSISLLPKILSRVGSLPAVHPRNGEPVQPGHIYVAPPNYHLLLQHDRICLSQGPRENGHRPAIDTLFRSAAWEYGPRTVGIILSGTLDDGVAGLKVIQAQGGITIAQDPEEALFDGMPRSAIQNVKIDYVLKLEAIAFQLIQLVQQPVNENHQPKAEEVPLSDQPDQPGDITHEAEIVAQDKAASERGSRSGTASTLTCPDCGGVLWEIQSNDLVRFRCHVGHAYSLESLLAEQADDLERALWAAARALEEKAALSRRMANHAKQQHRRVSEMQFLERAQEAAQQADLLRQIISRQIDLRQETKSEEGESLNARSG